MYKFLFSLFFLLAVPFSFAACSDDDEEYVPDSVDLIIQQLQSETYYHVKIYQGGNKVAEGSQSIILGFDKPFIIVDTSGGSTQYSSQSRFDLTKLAEIHVTVFDSEPTHKYLTLSFY